AASKADAELLARGGRGDFQWGDKLPYPAVKTDRILNDGDRIEVGGAALTAHITPGHTKGCTTWTMKVSESNRAYNVVFVGGTSGPEYTLVGNQSYPNILDDYENTFRTLRALPCGVFLAAHGSFFSLLDKRKRQQRGAASNPFIDPAGYKAYLDRSEKELSLAIREQQAAKSR